MINSENTKPENNWVINVGGYGAFLFEGSESEAEDMRIHKARWEAAIAIKREADPIEIKTGAVNRCWNHQNFVHVGKGFTYACDCCA